MRTQKASVAAQWTNKTHLTKYSFTKKKEIIPRFAWVADFNEGRRVARQRTHRKEIHGDENPVAVVVSETQE